MTSFNPRLAIIDSDSTGCWTSTMEFFDGFFNYDNARYRVIGKENEKIVLEKEDTNNQAWIKIVTVVTLIFPIIGGLCFLGKWLRSGSYIVIDGKDPGSSKPFSNSLDSKETEQDFLYSKETEQDYQYRKESHKVEERISRQENYVTKHRIELNDDLFFEVEIDSNQKLLKLDPHFVEGLKLIFLEHPSYDYFYVKAFNAGKAVYLSINDEVKGKSLVICRDEPLPGSYEYPIEQKGPVYEIHEETFVSNQSLVYELLKQQEEENLGQYIAFRKYNPITKNYEVNYVYAEKIKGGRKRDKREIKTTLELPKDRLPYKFGTEETTNALQGKKLIVEMLTNSSEGNEVFDSEGKEKELETCQKKTTTASQISTSQVPPKLEPGVAPDREKAKKFLKHPSIAPGSSVYYLTDQGEKKRLSLGTVEEKFLNPNQIYDPSQDRMQLDDDLVIPIERMSCELSHVNYLGDWDKVDGQVWEFYLPYRDALKRLFLQHPNDSFFYVKALKNGRVVYLYIGDEDENGKSKIVCRDKPLEHTFEYKSVYLEKWPFYETKHEIHVHNYHLVQSLLDLQKEEDLGKYVVLCLYNPKTEEYETSYHWAEKSTKRRNEGKIEKKCSAELPKDKSPYVFDEEEIKAAFRGKAIIVT